MSRFPCVIFTKFIGFMDDLVMVSSFLVWSDALNRYRLGFNITTWG